MKFHRFSIAGQGGKNKDLRIVNGDFALFTINIYETYIKEV